MGRALYNCRLNRKGSVMPGWINDCRWVIVTDAEAVARREHAHAERFEHSGDVWTLHDGALMDLDAEEKKRSLQNRYQGVNFFRVAKRDLRPPKCQEAAATE